MRGSRYEALAGGGGRELLNSEAITEAIRPFSPPGEFGARHLHTLSTSANHRIRHGIRHTVALAGRRHRPRVPNGRLRHRLIGYARVSKADGSQSLDLQRVALQAAGVDAVHVYHDVASGVRDDRPGLDSGVRALRTGDVLVVWKLDRLGRTLAHLVNTVQNLSARGVGLRVLTGQGAQIDTTTAAGRLVFGIFAALAEFERELIRERTLAGLTAARPPRRQNVRARRLPSDSADPGESRSLSATHVPDMSDNRVLGIAVAAVELHGEKDAALTLSIACGKRAGRGRRGSACGGRHGHKWQRT